MDQENSRQISSAMSRARLAPHEATTENVMRQKRQQLKQTRSAKSVCQASKPKLKPTFTLATFTRRRNLSTSNVEPLLEQDDDANTRRHSSEKQRAILVAATKTTTTPRVNKMKQLITGRKSAAAMETTQKQTKSTTTRTKAKATRRQQLDPKAPPTRRHDKTRSFVTSTAALSLALLALSLFLANMTPGYVNGIKLQPEGREKFYWSGEQFVITCQNSNNIKNVKIRWTGPNGEPITENRSARVHAESSGPHGHRLVVKNAELDTDEGVYNCTIGSADSRLPRESAHFALRLLKATNFKNTAAHVMLPAGQQGHIDCSAEFDPSVSNPTITWFKGQQPVDMLNDSSLQVVEYNADRQVSQLILRPVRRDHEDNYTCTALAETSHLSKIIEHKIELKVQFGPVFDSPEQTIWVESMQAMSNRQFGSGGGGLPSNGQQQQQQQQLQTLAHRQVFSGGAAPRVGGRGGRLRTQTEPSTEQSNQANSANEQIVRVELKCACQANPEARLMWFSKSAGRYEIVKGKPAHVLEEPITSSSGYNYTSTLVVAYNLDPSWEFRQDEYTCSATNGLGTAKKTFKIEQGNPPPAFLVGPKKTYDAENKMFTFLLLGPSSTVDPNQLAGVSDIVPPVDAFRIRAESVGPTAGQQQSQQQQQQQIQQQQQHVNNNGQQHNQDQAHQQQQQHQERLRGLRRQSASEQQSVQFAYSSLGADNKPQNVSVNLGSLPTGQLWLYLEAHNAVGWSPNSTNLGEFYLVSSALSSSSYITSQNLLILMACQLAAASSYLTYFLFPGESHQKAVAMRGL